MIMERSRVNKRGAKDKQKRKSKQKEKDDDNKETRDVKIENEKIMIE